MADHYVLTPSDLDAEFEAQSVSFVAGGDFLGATISFYEDINGEPVLIHKTYWEGGEQLSVPMTFSGPFSLLAEHGGLRTVRAVLEPPAAGFDPNTRILLSVAPFTMTIIDQIQALAQEASLLGQF